MMLLPKGRGSVFSHAVLKPPVYPEDEIQTCLSTRAALKGVDCATVVNDLLRSVFDSACARLADPNKSPRRKQLL
jgi:predicted thioredoxin/glutaredoxin